MNFIYMIIFFTSLLINIAILFTLARYHYRVKGIYNQVTATNKVTQDTLYESNEANKEILSNLHSAQLAASMIKETMVKYEKQLESKYNKNQLLFGVTQKSLEEKYKENRNF